MAGFSLSNPFSSRAVLFLTDDGVTLHQVKGKTVSFVGSETWKGEGFDSRIEQLLYPVRGTSVTILNDAVEQHYRKEKVVVVTLLDKKNMVQRRLNVSFPNYPMRAAMALKAEVDKAAPKQEGPRGEPYLFAAVPSTESYSRLVRGLSQSEVGVSGYGLLPVESVQMVKTLSGKLAQRWGGTSGATWSILIGQHHGGGLRQIVIRGGELALTRVTPVDEPNPEAVEIWAGDVSQELQATLSYLSRFGYSPEDGINIMVVGNPQYTALLEDLINVPCNFEALSPLEAGRLLNISLRDPQGASHYADGLHAGWVAKKVGLTLPLVSRELQAIARPRKTATAIMLGLNVILAGALYISSEEAQGIYRASRNLEVAENRKTEIDRLYQEEVKRKEMMGIDVNLIKGSLDIHGRLFSQRTDVLALIEDVSRSLETLRIDGFEYKNEGDALTAPNANPSDPATKANTRNVSLVLKLSFAGNIRPQDGNKDMQELANRISQKILAKGYEIEVSKPLEDLTYKGEIDREVGLTASARATSERYQAEITIKKAMK